MPKKECRGLRISSNCLEGYTENKFWENTEKYLKGSELEDLFEDLNLERKKLHKKPKK